MTADLNESRALRRLLRRSEGALKSLAAAGDVPAWAQERSEQFHRLVTDPDPAFPCYFAVIAEGAEALRFTYLEADELDSPHGLGEALCAFLEEHSPSRRPRTALVVFVQEEGRAATSTLACDEERFWRIVQGLHDLDSAPWPADVPTDPEDPGWTFCFASTPLFIAGHSRGYRSRLSRKAEGGMFLVVQPRTNLEGVTGRGAKAESVRRRIRGLLASYDPIPPSPDLGVYGEPTSREWRQYWLADHNEPVTRTCPLVIHSAGSRPRPKEL